MFIDNIQHIFQFVGSQFALLLDFQEIGRIFGKLVAVEVAFEGVDECVLLKNSLFLFFVQMFLGKETCRNSSELCRILLKIEQFVRKE